MGPEESEDDLVSLDELAQELGVSLLTQDAIHMHELYLSLTRAGFTEDQALKLVALLADQVGPDTVFIVDDDGDEDGGSE
jgi:hypothetical protein